MSLESEINAVLDDFEHASSDVILEILVQIKPFFRNQSIAEYLGGKMLKIRNSAADEQEKKRQCKALLPYLDWYLQGL